MTHGIGQKPKRPKRRRRSLPRGTEAKRHSGQEEAEYKAKFCFSCFLWIGGKKGERSGIKGGTEVVRERVKRKMQHFSKVYEQMYHHLFKAAKKYREILLSCPEKTKAKQKA